MSDIEVFELDDDFDPLEDMGLTPDEDIEDYDYLSPIPDADRSVVPEPVVLTPEEKLAKLLVGIPGQKHRILHVLTLCEEPLAIAEVAERLDTAYPQAGSVYDAARLVQLLVEAEGLERLEAEGGTEGEAADEPDADADNATTDTMSVTPPAPSLYRTTDEGRQFRDARTGLAPVEELLGREPRYLPIYRRILEMTSAEGGCAKLELNKAIDADDLCQEPRRFAEYFLFRLEDVAAVRWEGAWKATDLGISALDLPLFTA